MTALDPFADGEFDWVETAAKLLLDRAAVMTPARPPMIRA